MHYTHCCELAHGQDLAKTVCCVTRIENLQVCPAYMSVKHHFETVSPVRWEGRARNRLLALEARAQGSLTKSIVSQLPGACAQRSCM